METKIVMKTIDTYLTFALLLLAIGGFGQSNYYDVTANNGYGVRFWLNDR